VYRLIISKSGELPEAKNDNVIILQGKKNEMSLTAGPPKK
jgi:hypothetical protein